MESSSTTKLVSVRKKGRATHEFKPLTGVTVPNSFVLNLEFSKRIRALERKGMQIQYQLACLSTLGGAYHLCNHPETAFVIACRQELVGRLLGSLSVVIRAKVFQAVNLALLDRPRASKELFKACKRVAAENSWTGMAAFVEASRVWLAGQQRLTNGATVGSDFHSSICDGFVDGESAVIAVA